MLRRAVDGSVVVQARHGSLSKPTNFFNVHPTFMKMLSPLAPKIRAVCSLETQTRLQAGVGALNVALQQPCISRQRSSRSFPPTVQKHLSQASKKQPIFLAVAWARLPANSQQPLLSTLPVPQAVSPCRRSVLSDPRQGEPRVTRCRYPRGPPRVAVVLDPGWRGARDSRWRSVAGPRAPAGAQLRLRAVGPPAPFYKPASTLPARRVAAPSTSLRQCYQPACTSPKRPH